MTARAVEWDLSDRPASELERHLRRDELLALLQVTRLAHEGVLQLRLQVAPEAPAERSIEPPRVPIPRALTAVPVGHLSEELLVPSERAEKRPRELVATFHVVRGGIR